MCALAIGVGAVVINTFFAAGQSTGWTRLRIWPDQREEDQVNRQPTRPILGPTPRRRPRLRWLAAPAVAVMVVAALLSRPWSRSEPAPAAGAPTGQIVVSDSVGVCVQ
jgi:hypothetical protein